MDDRYVLRSVENAVRVGTTLPESWFRGHTTACGELEPRVFRKGLRTGSESLEGIEFRLVEHFKRRAPALVPSLPSADDHVRWLFLAQHHGLPTRLLDWTESALIGLYFAVNGDFEDDGELWVMHPQALNRRSGIAGLPTPNNPVLRYLAAEPFVESTGRRALANSMGLKSIAKHPLAFAPPLTHIRMVVQQSVFTIHPELRQRGSIQELLVKPEQLVRYRIPADCKRRQLDHLRALGITRDRLFPSLDALCEAIVVATRIVAYTPPAPPMFAP